MHPCCACIMRRGGQQYQLMTCCDAVCDVAISGRNDGVVMLNIWCMDLRMFTCSFKYATVEAAKVCVLRWLCMHLL